MLEGVRRQLAHRSAEKEKERLRKIEVERRLSVIKTKRLEEMRSAEEELREQKRVEIASLTETRQTYAERKRAEKELRQMTPGVGRRMARVTKKAFYDVPVKTVKALSRPGTGEKLRKAIIGDPTIILGKGKAPEKREAPKQSMEEFLYGKPSGDKGRGIGKDILS